MNRAITLALLVTMLTPPAAVGQVKEGFFDIELRTVPVAGNVYMVQRADGFANFGVFVGEEGVLLVDSQFEPHAEDLVSAVRKLSDGDIEFLVNTHVHPDHIGGNAPLATDGVLIFAHDNMRVRMLESRSRFPRGNGGFVPQPPAEARPFVTYDKGITFHFSGEEVRVFLAPPAHTDGDTFVHFPESDMLHLGDAFRTMSYPIIDVYNGGTLAGTIEALDLAISMAGPDTKIIPGHGVDVVGREALVEFRDMIVDVSQRVRELIAEGKTLDAVMAAKPTAAYDKQWALCRRGRRTTSCPSCTTNWAAARGTISLRRQTCEQRKRSQGMSVNEISADLAVGWIEAWVRMDMAWLKQRLAPDFVHTSSFGRLAGRDFYLDTVAPMARKSVQQLEIKQVIASGDRAAIWFENRTPAGVIPSCDWIRVENGMIKEIQSFYDSAKVRDVLSPDEQDKLGNSN